MAAFRGVPVVGPLHGEKAPPPVDVRRAQSEQLALAQTGVNGGREQRAPVRGRRRAGAAPRSDAQPLETLSVRPTLAELKKDWSDALAARDAYVKA
jgi:hypothetical protein